MAQQLDRASAGGDGAAAGTATSADRDPGRPWPRRS